MIPVGEVKVGDHIDYCGRPGLVKHISGTISQTKRRGRWFVLNLPEGERRLHWFENEQVQLIDGEANA